jgi:hypothetical protein
MQISALPEIVTHLPISNISQLQSQKCYITRFQTALKLYLKINSISSHVQPTKGSPPEWIVGYISKRYLGPTLVRLSTTHPYKPNLDPKLHTPETTFFFLITLPQLCIEKRIQA